DHHLNVVERTVGLARRIDAPGIVGVVAAGIPAADREVETAGEGQRIVHYDQLLVLGGAERHRRIEAEGDLRRHLPVEGEARERFAFVCVNERIVPEKQMNLQLWTLRREFREESRETGRKPIG